jgi:hypothetical protein
MGAPSFSMSSETFVQHIEVTKIVHILLQYHMVSYFRYVHDFLIVYKQNLTNIYRVFQKELYNFESL